MKVKLLGLLLIISVPLFSQGIGSLSFIHELGDRGEATFGDAVHFFMLTMEKEPKGFTDDMKALENEGLTKGMEYAEKTPLTRGALSLMAARYLKLQDSLFFMLFETERYAFRACIANGLMTSNGSEWDTLSGEEVIEIMTIVSEKKSGGKE